MSSPSASHSASTYISRPLFGRRPGSSPYWPRPRAAVFRHASAPGGARLTGSSSSPKLASRSWVGIRFAGAEQPHHGSSIRIRSTRPIRGRGMPPGSRRRSTPDRPGSPGLLIRRADPVLLTPGRRPVSTIFKVLAVDSPLPSLAVARSCGTVVRAALRRDTHQHHDLQLPGIQQLGSAVTAAIIPIHRSRPICPFHCTRGPNIPHNPAPAVAVTTAIDPTGRAPSRSSSLATTTPRSSSPTSSTSNDRPGPAARTSRPWRLVAAAPNSAGGSTKRCPARRPPSTRHDLRSSSAQRLPGEVLLPRPAARPRPVAADPPPPSTPSKVHRRPPRPGRRQIRSAVAPRRPDAALTPTWCSRPHHHALSSSN